MPLHDCSHTFKELAETVLPSHMDRMRVATRDPWNMSTFAQPRVGVKSIIRDLKRPSDFSGCYALHEGDVPIYVGISRGVVGRLRQHVLGRSHNDASLAFQIAVRRHPDRAVEQMKRAEAMAADGFGTSFEEAKEYLASLTVAAIEISNPLELYVFEAYCAIELDTHQWNSFATH